MPENLFKGKKVIVKLTDQALEGFEALTKLVGDEIAKGITSSEHQTLFNSIKQKIEVLKQNPHIGTQISKNKIPKEYVAYYDAKNLWKLNLPKYWRLLYTIFGDEVKIKTLVLDVMDHKKYDKKFGYKR